jgi:SAM-dependent methyltransferase
VNARQAVEWTEDGREFGAEWRSIAGSPPPKRVAVVDDSLPAAVAYRMACEGTALLWRGDYHNGVRLLQAMARRVDRKPPRAGGSPAESFHLHRQARGRRARVLSMVLVPFEQGYRIGLRRAPEVREACLQAYGPDEGPFLTSLRELQGVLGAYQWRLKGVPVPALGGERIHPWHGVFSPVRGEYVDLVAQAPLPSEDSAFDIGTGTGVLAAVLARRGVRRVVATDADPRAVGSARQNLARLQVAGRVEVVEADMFPEGRAPLVVCNPPWLPGKPTSPLEYAVYDPGSRMLRAFLEGLSGHLTADGEGWLVLSDLAERLELRSREELLGWVEAAGLRVLDRLDARPRHPKSRGVGDALDEARAGEVTSLWRLAVS